MQYVIAHISGKQFLFKPGEWYDIDFIEKKFDLIFINKILLYKNKKNYIFGHPFFKKKTIFGKKIKNILSNKIVILKTKPKKNYTKKQGHKQLYTRIRIFF
jgi:large subunit ribosomal protein L21